MTWSYWLSVILALVVGVVAGWVVRDRRGAGTGTPPASGVDADAAHPITGPAATTPAAAPVAVDDDRTDEVVIPAAAPITGGTGTDEPAGEVTERPTAVLVEPEPAAVVDDPEPAAIEVPQQRVATDGMPEPVSAQAQTEPVEAEPVEPVAVEAEPVAVEPVAVEPVAVEAEPVVGVPQQRTAVEPAPELAVEVTEPVEAVEPVAASTDAAPAEVAQPVAAAPVAVAADPTQPADDFRRIQGIGPKIATALQAAGIRTYRQLADLDEAGLREVVRSAGLRAAPSLATWPQQARLLAGAPEQAATVMPVAVGAGETD